MRFRVTMPTYVAVTGMAVVSAYLFRRAHVIDSCGGHRFRLVDIGVPPGYDSSGIVGFGNAGGIVGWARSDHGKECSFTWQGGHINAVFARSFASQAVRPGNRPEPNQVFNVSNVIDSIRDIDSTPVLKVKDGWIDYFYIIPPTDSSSYFNVGANGVNADREVVGDQCDFQSCHAFLWRGSHTYDLNSLVKTAGWTLFSARDVDDKGEIIVDGEKDGVVHGFELIPIK